MATVSAYNTVSLRNNYGDYRMYSQKTNRKDVDSSLLSYADASALRRAIRGLGDYDYENSSDQDMYDKIRAFADTYNYTIDSARAEASENENRQVKASMKNLKKLASDNEKLLNKYGIKINNDGYMTVSDSAAKNISHEKFEKVFGKDTEFSSGINKYSKRITNYIDLYL